VISTKVAATTPLGTLRRRASGSHLMLPMADALTMLACFTLGGVINFSYQNVTEERSLILILLTGVCLAFFQYFGHYSRRRQFWQEIGDIALVAAVMLVFDAALLYLLKVNFSRVWVVSSWTLVILALPLVRRLVKQVSSSLGSWKQPTIVIGTGASAREIAEAYARESHLGYEVVAFLEPSAALEPEPLPDLGIAGRAVPVIPLDTSRGVLPEWLGKPHVVVALDLDEMLGRETFIETLSFYHGDIDVISPLKGLPINNTQVTHFFSRDILSLRIHNNLARPWAQLVKRAFDLAVACGIVLFIAPLMGLIALRIRLADRGAVLFSHTRIGRDGRPFPCYKFRTMVPAAGEVLARVLAEDPRARAEWERDRKLKNDPRITRIGRFLRKTSLDELPQLFNVIRGEMSLVGPRPVVADELGLYGQAQIYYLQVRPGLTGLWQISGRNDVDYERRVSLDTWYVRNWTLWYDIYILLRTLLVVPSRSSGAY
jgi:undecaprenyl-phosphate galactose phosphotransferase